MKPLSDLLTQASFSSRLRSQMECRGRKRDGEIFLAQVWFSVYVTDSGPRLAVCLWDASEDLRDRESANVASAMATSRVLVGALAHELRNLSAAASVVHDSLAERHALSEDKDFQALGSLVHGLQGLASNGLSLAATRSRALVDLDNLMDQAYLVLAPVLESSGARLNWRIPENMPLVHGDNAVLLQVFVNLTMNSERAMRSSPVRDLTVEVDSSDDLVSIRFRDTGPGVADPQRLFRPFQGSAEGAGLGLYISRAVVRSYGGDLRYEPQVTGACFAIELPLAQSGA